MSLIITVGNLVEKALGSFALGRKVLPSFLGIRRRIHFRLKAMKKGSSASFESGVVRLRRGNRQILFPELPVYFFDEANDYFEDYFTSFESEERDGFIVLDFSKTEKQTLKFLGVPLLVPTATEGEWPLTGYTRMYMPKEGDVVFDGGAFCGITTYYFSRLVGSAGRVYAFEPDEDNYKILLENIKLHNLVNVIPVKKGLFSHSTTLSFNNIGFAYGRLSDPGDPQTSSVEVLSLADAYKEFNLHRLDFVKLDIEGAEVEVIEGAREFLKDKNVHFAIASYHYRDGQQTYKILEKMFTEIGYQAQTGFPRHKTTWAAGR